QKTGWPLTRTAVLIINPEDDENESTYTNRFFCPGQQLAGLHEYGARRRGCLVRRRSPGWSSVHSRGERRCQWRSSRCQDWRQIHQGGRTAGGQPLHLSGGGQLSVRGRWSAGQRGDEQE